MKKANFLYLFLLFFSLCSLAQEVRLEWSDEIINTNKAKPNSVLFKINNELLVYSAAKGNKGFFEVYDEDKGKLKSSKEFEFKKGKDEYFLESFILVDDKILIVATITDKEKYTIYTNYCDFKGKLIGKWNEIDVVKREKRKDKKSIKFFYIQEKKKLFAFKPDFSKKYDKETFTLISYDENFDQTFKKKISLPYPAGVFDLTSLRIDKNEKAYISGNVDRKMLSRINKKNDKADNKTAKKSNSKKKSKSEDDDSDSNDDDDDNSDEVVIESEDDSEDGGKKKGKSKSKSNDKKVKIPKEIPTLFAFNFANADSVSAREFKIDLKEKYVINFNYKILPNNQLLIVGFYANNNRSIGANGVFSGKFDLTSEESPVIKTEKFDKKFLERMCGSEKERITKLGIPYLKVHDISIFDDGTYMASGDNYHEYVSCSTGSNGQQRCTRYYIANDIFCIKFNAENAIDFFSYIPRRQIIAVPEVSFSIGFVSLTPNFAQPKNGSIYMRHSLLKKGDKLYFIYNDNPKNFDPPKKSKKSKKPVPHYKNTEYPFTTSKTGIQPVLVILDKDGVFDKQTLPGPGGEIKSKKGAKSSKSSTGKKSKADKEKDKSNKKYRFIPRNSYIINEDEIVSFSMNTSGKSYRLVNLKVTE